MNWKTMLGAIGLFTLIGGWMITGYVAAETKTGLKETNKEVNDIKLMVVEQKVANEEQHHYNETLNEVLKELKSK